MEKNSQEQPYLPGRGQPPRRAPVRVGKGDGALGSRAAQTIAIDLHFPEEGSMTGPLQVFPMPALPCVNPHAGPRSPRWWSALNGEDASRPLPVAFQWQCAMHHLEGLRYDLLLRAEDGSAETFALRGLREPSAEVENLRVGTAYTWKVRARLGRRVVARSTIGSFITNPALPRWIHVLGSTNIRDMGGWPLADGKRIRQGMVFRGAELNSHCTLAGPGAYVLERVLKIRTDLDLRGPGEDRMPVLDGERVQYVNIPLASYDMIASPQYTRMYRELFGLLARREQYPVYMHCWGGADRTGTVAFLLGALLGMCPDDLATEYELTSLSVWGERRSDAEAFQEMLQILSLFAPSGSDIQIQVEAYLRSIGVTRDEIAAIRGLLIAA